MRLFHGGKPGLEPGDVLVPEPHYVNGCPECERHARGEAGLFEPLTDVPDHVYVTTDREYARFYASKYPRGDLYSVEVDGEAFPSPTDPFESFHAERVVVRGVLDRYVMLTPKQRRRLLDRWAKVDRARGLP